MNSDFVTTLARTHANTLDAPARYFITDELLTELANPAYDAARGEFDAETRAMLAIALPEMAAELLRWRHAARTRPHALALALRSEAIEARLDAARRAIRAPEPIGHRTLAAACETLLRHSTDITERAAAAEVLAQMKKAA